MSADEKRVLEHHLVNAYESIPFSSGDTAWILTPEFQTFINRWKELREFYIVHDTPTDFHVEVIGVYLDVTALLRKLCADTAAQEMAAKALTEVEYWMSELVKEAERNLHFVEGMSGEV